MLIAVRVLRICYLENLRPDDIERKFVVSTKYLRFRKAVHMPTEERLRTRYHKVTAYRS
jgi:hypothetical protein